MENTIKLAVIHSTDASMWEEGDPYSSMFDPTVPQRFVDSNIEKMLEFLHEAGRCKADLVCTHEDFKGSGVYMRYLDYPELFSSLVEAIPGPTSNKIGEIAKLYNMLIAANYFEKDGSEIYNTTILMGRTGEIIGKYRKVHLPPSENWRVTAGKEFSVFETDIGKIGFAICYDIYFPEHCRAVALNGANIILHQTQGWGISSRSTGEALVRIRAAENSVHMVVAKNIQLGDGGKSCIINNYGNILAEAPGEIEKVIAAEFEPDFDMIHEDQFDTFLAGVKSVKAMQTFGREPSLYSILISEKPPVLEQFKGMELQNTPEKIKKVFRQWKEYLENVRNNIPVKIKYHW